MWESGYYQHTANFDNLISSYLEIREKLTHAHAQTQKIYLLRTYMKTNTRAHARTHAHTHIHTKVLFEIYSNRKTVTTKIQHKKDFAIMVRSEIILPWENYYYNLYYQFRSSTCIVIFIHN
jgi:hypothetical protein